MVGALTRSLSDGRPNGFVRFLLLSLGLHAAILFFIGRVDVATPPVPPVPALSVLLPPPRFVPGSGPQARIEAAPKSAVAARPPMLLTTQPGNPAPATALLSPAPAAPVINLETAIATVRAYAREAQPRTSPDAQKPMLTVETAIARAAVPDVVIETRGAAGEYVTNSKHSRCVTPLTVPHFMEGKSMLTQCDVSKG